MSDQLEGEPIDAYEMRIIFAFNYETGETAVELHEHGERANIITQLGMLDLARDAILQRHHEDEADDD